METMMPVKLSFGYPNAAKKSGNVMSEAKTPWSYPKRTKANWQVQVTASRRGKPGLNKSYEGIAALNTYASGGCKDTDRQIESESESKGYWIVSSRMQTISYDDMEIGIRH